MIPILYLSDEAEFSSNGLGRLSDAITCFVEEERNGMYELEMIYPLNGIHFSEIEEGRFISAIPADGKNPQPFCIYRITKPLNGRITIYAHHISYKAKKMTVMPFSANGCAECFSNLPNYIIGDNPFTFWTDKNTSGKFELIEPSMLRSVLGGMEGSILDTFGTGEYEFDKWTCRFYTQRGSDNGVYIRYGKNLIDLESDVSLESVYTSVVPFWKGAVDSIEKIVMLPEKTVKSDHVNDYDYEMIVPLDLSSEFEDEPTPEQMRLSSRNYMSNNTVWKPDLNITVDFVQLWQTEEYKNIASLQRVNLCDIVNVEYEPLGINVSLKVIYTKYNVLLERYDRMELGDPKTYLSDVIDKNISNNLHQKIDEQKSDLMVAIEQATKLIAGGFGGHALWGLNDEGQPNELFFMDTDDVDTAVQILRINKNGIGFSKNGINGPYFSAWTLDGAFNADFITTGSLSATLINGGILKMGGNNNGNGIIEIYDSKNFKVATIDKDGMDYRASTTFTDVNSNPKYRRHSRLNSGIIEFISEQITDSSGNSIEGIEYRAGYIEPTKNYQLTIGHDSDVTYGNVTIQVKKKINGATSTSSLAVGYDSGGNSYCNLSVSEIQMLTKYLKLANYKYLYATSSDIRLGARLSDGNWGGGILIKQSGNNQVSAVQIQTNLYTSPTNVKSKLFESESYEQRAMYCYEMPNPYFGDIGCGKTDKDGFCYVVLDEVFQEAVNTGCQYQVFLQQEGDGKLWVSQKKPSYFIVNGTPELSFSWEVKVKQRNFEYTRMEIVSDDGDETTFLADEPDYLNEGNDYFSEFIMQQEVI